MIFDILINISIMANVIVFAIVLSIPISIWICIMAVTWGANVDTVIIISSLLTIKMNLGWRLRCWSVAIEPWCMRCCVRMMEIIGRGIRLMLRFKIATILVLVTLTPFVCCPMDGTVITIGKMLPFLFICMIVPCRSSGFQWKWYEGFGHC